MDSSPPTDSDSPLFSLDFSPRPAVDLIKWQGPQPSCPALSALLSEASRPTQKPRDRPCWDPNSPGRSPSRPGSTASRQDTHPAPAVPPSTKSRPPRLSRTARRPTPPTPPSAPADTPVHTHPRAPAAIPLFNGSPAEFLAYLSGVREQADECTRRRLLTRRKVAGGEGAGVGGEGDRCGAGEAVGRSGAGGRVEKEKARAKAKARPGVKARGREPVVAHRSLPNLDTAPGSARGLGLERASSMSMSMSASMDVDGAESAAGDGDTPTPMDIDLPSPPSFHIHSPPTIHTGSPEKLPIQPRAHTRAHMPPPPVPPKRPNAALPAHPSSSNTIEAKIHLPTPPPALPAVVLKPASSHAQLHTPSPSPSQPSYSQSQHQNPRQTQTQPRPSQSSRPPILGMRRPSTSTYSSLKPQTTVLPTRQRPFRPPLARCAPVPASVGAVVAGSERNVGGKEGRACGGEKENVGETMKEAEKEGEEEGKGADELGGEGDSSYGEISFDLDALEETMKMYD